MNDNAILELFSPSYATARRKFMDAAADRGLRIDSRVLDLPGAAGETLAIDVVLDGPAFASKLLVVLSGVHGVEGFCGSAIQTGMLRLGARAHPDTAVLHVHAINPHGFSHLRRVTQENVDLNRNFVDFSQPLPVNAGYGEIHEWLLPPSWPPGRDAESALAAYRDKHGERGLQRAIGLGQHAHPDGMFFGGRGPTWSNRTFRAILQHYGSGRAGSLPSTSTRAWAPTRWAGASSAASTAACCRARASGGANSPTCMPAARPASP